MLVACCGFGYVKLRLTTIKIDLLIVSKYILIIDIINSVKMDNVNQINDMPRLPKKNIYRTKIIFAESIAFFILLFIMWTFMFRIIYCDTIVDPIITLYVMCVMFSIYVIFLCNVP